MPPYQNSNIRTAANTVEAVFSDSGFFKGQPADRS